VGGSTARFINDPAAVAVASSGRGRGVHDIIIIIVCLPAAQAHQIPLIRPDAADHTSEGYYYRREK